MADLPPGPRDLRVGAQMNPTTEESASVMMTRAR